MRVVLSTSCWGGGGTCCMHPSWANNRHGDGGMQTKGSTREATAPQANTAWAPWQTGHLRDKTAHIWVSFCGQLLGVRSPAATRTTRGWLEGKSVRATKVMRRSGARGGGGGGVSTADRTHTGTQRRQSTTGVERSVAPKEPLKNVMPKPPH